MLSASYIGKKVQQELFKSNSWDSYKNNNEYTNSFNRHKELKNRALKKKDYVKANYHEEVMSAILSERKKPSSEYKKLVYQYSETKYSKKKN
jgi:hypothetical protein